jgi:mRNA-degrading endonuclease RelE of RelBE toxin-antitoxin system
VAKRSLYSLVYAPEVHAHVDAIDRKYHRQLRETIKAQLSFTPELETRNRKPLERTPGPYGATWELRCGPGNRFRVFYEVEVESRQVWILAIGTKDHARLFIAGKEFTS